MKSFFYLLTILGGIVGAALIAYVLTLDSAPQQGAGAAIGVAFAVIPYCMARAFEKIRQEPLAKTLERLLTSKS